MAVRLLWDGYGVRRGARSAPSMGDVELDEVAKKPSIKGLLKTITLSRPTGNT